MTTVATTEPTPITPHQAVGALDAAASRIAPVWPLDRFVAVNPYFGLAERAFGDAAHLLARVGGARSTMPIAWYLRTLDAGGISSEALRAALAGGSHVDHASPDQFLAQCRLMAVHADGPSVRIPTVARTAAAFTGLDLEHLMTDRIAAWAASHFDGGQVTWRSSEPTTAAYASWHAEAAIDRTPDVMGLRGFRRAVQGLPSDRDGVVEQAAVLLGLDGDQMTTYVHALLMQVGGWAAHCAWIGFEASLRGETDDTLQEFAAVLLAWELALHEALDGQGLGAAWRTARTAADWSGDTVDAILDAELVLQEALDRTEQDRIVAELRPGMPTSSAPLASRPDAQAVFCIDVRSEVFRRHLEATGADIETLGFAGFFGMAIEYVPIAHEHGSPQCPVLLRPAHTVVETTAAGGPPDAAGGRRRSSHQVRRAWKSFKMGAISCFSFVGPVGLIYLPKLFTDGSGRTRPTPRADAEGLSAAQAAERLPDLTVATTGSRPTGIDHAARVALAEGMLRGTSLHDDLAPLVLLVGHGATTVNNPYESSLHCGACGGNPGDANARVASAILNDPAVRASLAERGLIVPDDTWFVGALHDTTTDTITVYDRASVPAHLTDGLCALEADLAAAGRSARAERAPRLGIADGSDVEDAVTRRSTDWAQVRPEWALAGCRAFVAAPRGRTASCDLGGEVFLHSYDWRRDDGFGVLELILTAPVVVASWISLQYYASTVEPRIYGSGNKTLHNVVGRIGVLEGNGGDLRVGLPWQSVHDGTSMQHQPLRLNVVIEAPRHAIDDVLARNQHIADLCHHGWIQLLAMDDDGHVTHRHQADGSWTAA